MTAPVALLGAHGFIGSAISRSLEGLDIQHVAVPSPRLTTSARDWRTLLTSASRHDRQVRRLSSLLSGCSVAINAAGVPGVTERASDELYGANGLLPLILARACAFAGIRRLVHMSSAAVQGRRPVLDEAEDAMPISPYSTSKALGERAVLSAAGPVQVVVYRPTSVHGLARPITRSLARVARSPFACVAGQGTDPTPQVLVENVAHAVCFVATHSVRPPPVVLHPSEGWTTAGILELLGAGHRPRRLPVALARSVIRAARVVGRVSPAASANVRRVELLWMGQPQAAGWLARQGWAPPVGVEGWQRLVGREVATEARGTS